MKLRAIRKKGGTDTNLWAVKVLIKLDSLILEKLQLTAFFSKVSRPRRKQSSDFSVARITKWQGEKSWEYKV